MKSGEDTQAEVRLVDAEVLTIGPEDRLIVKANFGEDPAFATAIAELLDGIGLAGRVLVINENPAMPIELAVARAEPA